MKSAHEEKRKIKEAASMVYLGLLKVNFTESSNLADTDCSLRPF